MSVDVYPPMWDVVPSEVDITAYQDHDATVWVPGVHAENPLAMGGGSTPVEKAIAYGFGTTTTGSERNAQGRGVRTDTGWQVVISKPLAGLDDGEVSFDPGAKAACAFAVWAGAVHDAGSRKAPSIDAYSLVLER